MQPLEIPEFPVLRGEKAIRALYDFINELEEQRGKELTEKQITALIKLAKGLISSVEAETRFATAHAHSPLPFSPRATPYWYALLETRLI